MIFRPIPQFTVEDNAKYECKVDGSLGTYRVVIIIDECNDDRLVTRESIDIEHTNCTCKAFTMTKVPMCKHITGFIEQLRNMGIKIMGVPIEPHTEK
jgi:hypothetical protein